MDRWTDGCGISVYQLIRRYRWKLLDQHLEPFLTSRARVRAKFRETMRTRGSLNALAAATVNESFFGSGHVFKERNDGGFGVMFRCMGHETMNACIKQS